HLMPDKAFVCGCAYCQWKKDEKMEGSSTLLVTTPTSAPIDESGCMAMGQTSPLTDHFTFECRHCPLGFADQNIHTLHMSYHSLDNPLQCSKCGHICESALHFNMHLMQSCHV
ncbi:hypothetical protein PENTCL1PPCAC_25389, partial [Pristionchus entomophagus]